MSRKKRRKQIFAYKKYKYEEVFFVKVNIILSIGIKYCSLTMLFMCIVLLSGKRFTEDRIAIFFIGYPGRYKMFFFVFYKDCLIFLPFCMFVYINLFLYTSFIHLNRHRLFFLFQDAVMIDHYKLWPKWFQIQWHGHWAVKLATSISLCVYQVIMYTCSCKIKTLFKM